ncbi:ATP-binding cassette domain-containing protein [Microbacterium sp. p3-SID336]|uniref:ATP-binding cassette domain-containing protein n=1 Tax=Microbacterium sp. p3-SID336 TaxID=2916212 RepID=UPI0021A7E861|nr:ATP-binding cassette domain-containing protein [Microbacterium sp. p3-SID336]MCT1477196.1 ATP-binding cassette domain-containing protein [Microbacterium sp. p3-SID336]
MPEGQVLEFTNVTKRFNELTAVSDFSARVEPGAVTAFLGPNGAGKTTTLRILLGQVRATSGTATIGGVAYPELRQPLRTIGSVLEETVYRPRRTAARQLTIAAKANGIRLSRVDEVLSLVGLDGEADSRIGGFSLGMRQRLSVAGALLGDPGALVFDEPANGLDPEGIRWMRLLMRRLADEGRTVLVSSHVLSEIEQVADHVLVLSKGRLVLSSGIETLADPAGGAVVVDAVDREALTTALTTAGFDVEVLRGGLTVRGGDATTVGAVAAEAGIALSTLVQRGPTLEDVFIDLMRGGRFGSAPSATASLDAPTAEGTAGGAADAGVAAAALAAGGAAALADDLSAERLPDGAETAAHDEADGNSEQSGPDVPDADVTSADVADADATGTDAAGTDATDVDVAAVDGGAAAGAAAAEAEGAGFAAGAGFVGGVAPTRRAAAAYRAEHATDASADQESPARSADHGAFGDTDSAHGAVSAEDDSPAGGAAVDADSQVTADASLDPADEAPAEDATSQEIAASHEADAHATLNEADASDADDADARTADVSQDSVESGIDDADHASADDTAGEVIAEVTMADHTPGVVAVEEATPAVTLADAAPGDTEREEADEDAGADATAGDAQPARSFDEILFGAAPSPTPVDEPSQAVADVFATTPDDSSAATVDADHSDASASDAFGDDEGAPEDDHAGVEFFADLDGALVEDDTPQDAGSDAEIDHTSGDGDSPADSARTALTDDAPIDSDAATDTGDAHTHDAAGDSHAATDAGDGHTYDAAGDSDSATDAGDAHTHDAAGDSDSATDAGDGHLQGAAGAEDEDPADPDGTRNSDWSGTETATPFDATRSLSDDEDDPRAASVSSMLSAAARAYYEDEPRDYPFASADEAARAGEGAHWSVASTGVIDTVPLSEPASDTTADSGEQPDSAHHDGAGHDGEQREQHDGGEHDGEQEQRDAGAHHDGEQHGAGHDGEHHEQHDGGEHDGAQHEQHDGEQQGADEQHDVDAEHDGEQEQRDAGAHHDGEQHGAGEHRDGEHRD